MQAGPKLGVGLLHNPALLQYLDARAEAYDFLALIPDREWADHGAACTPRFEMPAPAMQFLQRLRARKPMVCHSIGLSIGSAAWFDTGHVAQIAWLQQQLGFAWHSDHLAFSRIPDPTAGAAPGQQLHTAIALPVPYDEDVLALIVQRVHQVQATVDAAFLLENNVHYASTPEQDMDEPEFLNRLCSQTGCGLLLDLHNLYVNQRNHGLSAERFLADLDLRPVVEIHLAGGDELLGHYTDSHAGPVAEPVWQLLDEVLRAAPWVRAVTFEFHESSYPLLRQRGIDAQLARARRIWDAHC